MQSRSSKGFAKSIAIIYLSLALVSPAKAFLPVAVLAAPQIVTAAGSSYAIGALAGLVGVVGAYLLVKDALDNQVAIPLGENERNAIPEPAAPANVDSTTTTGYSYQGSNYTSLESVCSAVGAYQQQIAPTVGYTKEGVVVNGHCYLRLTNHTGGWGDGTFSDSSLTVPNPTTVISCPTGYTSQSGTCTLVNPRQAVDDKRCDLLLAGGQFSTANDLNCPSTVDGTKAAPIIRDGKAIAYGTNSSGQPLVFTVAPSETVGDRDWVTVKVQEQVQTDTQTQVKTTTVTIDPATSTVTGVQTQTQVGSITSPSTGTIPTVQTGTATPATTPTVTTDPTTQTQPDININTCGLPGQPACAVDDTGFATQPKPWESKDFQPDLDKKKSLIDELTSPDLAWRDFLPSFMPGEPTECHPIEFRGAINVGPAAGMDSTTMFDMCWILGYVRMFIGFLFGCGSLMYVWRRVTNAKGQSYGE